jgi:hypothetical protein
LFVPNNVVSHDDIPDVGIFMDRAANSEQYNERRPVLAHQTLIGDYYGTVPLLELLGGYYTVEIRAFRR